MPAGTRSTLERRLSESTSGSRIRSGRVCTLASGEQSQVACATSPTTWDRRFRGSVPSSACQVTNAVINNLKMLEVDTKHFSGLSMRRGGISAGLVAGVPEPILFLQSGHGSNCAARNYMVPRNPHILFETYNAFGL